MGTVDVLTLPSPTWPEAQSRGACQQRSSSPRPCPGPLPRPSWDPTTSCYWEDEVYRWAAAHSLTISTADVLREEGFTSLSLLACLTPQDIKDNFQATKLLPLAQCLALRSAVAQLAQGARAPAECSHAPIMSSANYSNGGDAVDTGRPSDLPSRHVHMETSHLETEEMSDFIVIGKCTDDAAVLADRGHMACDTNHTAGRSDLGVGACGGRDTGRNQEPEEELRFLLVGKTGSGKSTTGNTILGEDRFPTELAFCSVTATCQLERRSRDGITVEIMDSPGLFDTERSHEDIAADIVKAVACMHPGPHAVLYVIKLGRYTEEEHDVYQRLKALFDDALVKFMVVVFTGGDSLEGLGKSMADVLQSAPKELQHVLAECDNRYIVFNNMADNTGPQVQQLFRQVRQLTAQHGGLYYTCPKYADVSEGVEQEVARRLAEVDRRHADKTGYVQHLRQEAEAAQQGVDDERARFEERERERQQRMEEEQERARQKMEEMMQEMQRQHADAKQQQEKERRLRFELEMQVEEQKRTFAAQREADRQKLEQREREFQELKNKEQEIQWNTEETPQVARREVLRTMKDRVARAEEEGFVERFKAKIVNMMKSAKKKFTQFVTQHRVK